MGRYSHILNFSGHYYRIKRDGQVLTPEEVCDLLNSHDADEHGPAMEINLLEPKEYGDWGYAFGSYDSMIGRFRNVSGVWIVYNRNGYIGKTGTLEGIKNLIASSYRSNH